MASRCAGLSCGAAATSLSDMVPGRLIDMVARPSADGINADAPAGGAAPSWNDAC
jgi:hypothetical protein